MIKVKKTIPDWFQFFKIKGSSLEKETKIARF